MGTATLNRIALGLRITPEQHRLVAEAAAREHRSLNSFVLKSALAAASQTPRTQRRSPEEVMALIKAAQDEFGAMNMKSRDLLQELTDERRLESAGE